MVAALSWAARLKAGLARTRDVLNTPVSELFVRRRVDESLFEELETALLQADCGVPATQWLIETLRTRARKEKIEDGETLKAALKDALTELLSPLQKDLQVGNQKPCVLMIAGVNGSGKTTSIGKLAKWLQSQGKSVLLAAGALSTMTTRFAPREAASKPSAPVPAKRSRQLMPSSHCPSQLKSVSRTRSGVGRRPGRSGTGRRRPR